MKYKVNIATTFMDGTRANPGDVIDLDPAKITDLADVEKAVINMMPAIERVADDPITIKITADMTGKWKKIEQAVPDAIPPAQEVTPND